MEEMCFGIMMIAGVMVILLCIPAAAMALYLLIKAAREIE